MLIESCQYLVKEDVWAVSEKLEQAITRLNNDVIRDDGVGFDPSAQDGQGRGLLNMAARAQKIGARLQILSQPGRGTRIRVDIPNEAPYAG